MARPKKSSQVDLSVAQDLTAGLIERLTCPTDKAQAFLRDAKAPGLRVRVADASKVALISPTASYYKRVYRIGSCLL